MGVREKEMLLKEISMKQPDIVKYKNNSRKWLIAIIVGAVIACASVATLVAIFNFWVPDVVVGSTLLIIVFLINPVGVLLMGKVVYDQRKPRTEEMLDEAYASVIILREYFKSQGIEETGSFFETMTLDELSDAARKAERRMEKRRREEWEGKKEEKKKADES